MSQITALTANTSLATADLLVVVDVDDTTMAASGTDKKLLVGDLGTLVRSVPANAQSVPAPDPAGTVSLTLVMMGLGSSCAITPASSGKVLINITGFGRTQTAAVSFMFGPRFGTGTAPINGAAVTGTRFGMQADATIQSPVAGAYVPFAVTALLTLTPGTAYWFDMALNTSNAADAANLADMSFTALEVS